MSESQGRAQRPEQHRSLSDRAADSRAAARAAAEHYLRVRRRCQTTIEASQESMAMAQALREQLRDSVTTYAVALRHDQVLPERVVVLVKTAISESDAVRDQDHRALLDDVVRWAVDAYYAA